LICCVEKLYCKGITFIRYNTTANNKIISLFLN